MKPLIILLSITLACECMAQTVETNLPDQPILKIEWPNDEIRKLAKEWDSKNPFNPQGNPHNLTTFPLGDGMTSYRRIEFGLRSDGVVMWRDVK